MAKKLITCEVLSTVKGLFKDSPKEFTHAGTADNPCLVDLPDNDETRELIASRVIRIWPGPQSAAAASSKDTETQESLKSSQAALAQAKTQLKEAEEAAAFLRKALEGILSLDSLDAVKAAAEKALK
ncbi:MAG: hypothetical protein ACM31P_02210 [Actinomycetota bacterium]